MILSRKLLFILSLLFQTVVFAQKSGSFTGMLEYNIQAHDTTLINFLPNHPMIIYTNDTIIRKENFTDQLGKQVEIKHLVLNKSYILLNSKRGKFAIQYDLNNLPKDTVPSDYTFKKKLFRKKVLGKKANRMMVNHPSFKEPIEFLYYKGVSNKYNPVFDEIPGLVVKYSIVTIDGVLDYELVRFNEYTPNHDLFGVPSEFKRITFSEFVDIMTSPSNQQMTSPE